MHIERGIVGLGVLKGLLPDLEQTSRSAISEAVTSFHGLMLKSKGGPNMITLIAARVGMARDFRWRKSGILLLSSSSDSRSS
jgi:hypothetical protein